MLFLYFVPFFEEYERYINLFVILLFVKCDFYVLDRNPFLTDSLSLKSIPLYLIYLFLFNCYNGESHGGRNGVGPTSLLIELLRRALQLILV